MTLENDNLDIENPIDNNEPELSGEEELMQVIQKLQAESNEDDELDEELEESDELEEEELEEELDDNLEDELDEELDPESDEAKGKKREQSKEENARFAAERRQRELDEKVQAKLDEFKRTSPEFALAEKLSEQYGVPTEQLVQQLKEAQIKQEAAKLKVPVEFLRKQQEADARAGRLEAELNQLRFNNWQNQIQAEVTQLQSQFPMLTREDISQAETYILKVAKNPDMPLEQAVFALHGRKIIENKVETKVQDKLASDGGRKKKAALPLNNGKTVTSSTLTSEEKAAAKMMGISEADYLKYK